LVPEDKIDAQSNQRKTTRVNNGAGFSFWLVLFLFGLEFKHKTSTVPEEVPGSVTFPITRSMKGVVNTKHLTTNRRRAQNLSWQPALFPLRRTVEPDVLQIAVFATTRHESRMPKPA
jgi:hypothetical protein